MNEITHTVIDVREVTMKLMTYTRSLELCARMNYETENLDFIDRIAPGETLYDLGACEGRFSVYAAKRGINVVAFEPEAKNFSVLKQNIQLNEIDEKVKTVNFGIGAEDGTAILNIGQPWAGGHQKIVAHGEIRNDLNFNFVDSQTVNIVSLDSFIKKNSPPLPDYLKIDIDGSEMPFLEGAKKTLNQRRLKAIIFELNESDPHFASIIDFLNMKGFSEKERYQVPNEIHLYNIIFTR